MQIASCWVVINSRGSNVPKAFITPAELVLLVQEFKDVTGRFPVHNLEVFKPINNQDLAAIEPEGEREFMKLKERQRRAFEHQDSNAERARLRAKYGKPAGAKSETDYKIDRVFPGSVSKLPDTFEETGLFKQASVNGLTEEIVPMPSDDNLPALPVDEDVTDVKA